MIPQFNIDKLSEVFRVKIRYLRKYVGPIGSGMDTRYQISRQAYGDENFSIQPTILSHGGKTQVVLVDNMNNEYHGAATCCDQDQFNRKDGRNRAIKRALVEYAKATKTNIQQFIG